VTPGNLAPDTWPCPLPGGGISTELVMACDDNRAQRLLIVPALFDEANRMRRLTVEVMRRLDGAGLDCFLPDLPGCNESAVPLEHVTPHDWSDALVSAARHFAATHVLAIRGGCLVAPPSLPGWHYAPVSGKAILNQLLRSRIIATREQGLDETREGLLEAALANGIDVAGYALSADFVLQFEPLVPPQGDGVATIGQDMVGGSGLWLRAEPGDDRRQADALAAVIAIGMGT